MAQSAKNVLSFLVVIVIFSSLKIEARDIHRFSKFVNQAEQPPFSSSKLPLPTRSEPKNENGHGLYRQISYKFKNTKSSTDDNESEIPTKEFDETMFGFPNKYNQHLVPQNFKKGINDFYYTPTDDALADEKQLQALEDKIVYYNLNENTNFNHRREVDNVKGAQGMSDTRTLGNGMYFYNPGEELSYSQGSVKGGSNLIDNNQGYYGNGGDSKYEFHNMEEDELSWDP